MANSDEEPRHIHLRTFAGDGVFKHDALEHVGALQFNNCTIPFELNALVVFCAIAHNF